MRNDLLSALRLVRSNPWFSAAIVVTLAFGIGINTTIFTLANAVLFKPVPLPDGDRLTVISGQHPKQGDRRLNLSYPDFLAVKSDSKTLSHVEGTNRFQAIVSDLGIAPERYNATKVTSGLLPMLQTNPVLGRPLREGDFLEGSERVALIGYNVWKTRYGKDLDLIGRIVRINGQPTEIVGVMPEDFRFPSSEDIWTPYLPGDDFDNRTNRPLQVFSMLGPDSTLTEAKSEIALIAANLAQSFPDTNEDLGLNVLTFHQRFNDGPIRIVFLAMLGATGFVLMIACTNVANMLLSRGLARRQEIAIRSALGAKRGQIIRQLLVESISLSIVGGLVGLCITAFGVHAFDQATRDVGKPYWILFEIDYRVFAYFALVSVASGLLFGMVPALPVSRIDINSVLKEGTRGSGSRGSGRASGLLVAFQFAMTLVLLTGAGLMLRSFFSAQGLNSFIPAESILTASVALPERDEERYAEASARRDFYRELEQRLSAISGVGSFVLTSHLPGFGATSRAIAIDGQPTEDDENPPRVSFITQTQDYFKVIGLPILEGRGLETTDDESRPLVCIASHEFVEIHWPDESGLGKRFRFVEQGNQEDWITIVGVSANLIQQPSDSGEPALVYLPHSQRPWGYMNVMLRSRGDPLALASELKDAVQQIDTDLPVFNVRTLRQAEKNNYWFLNVFGTLFLSFAAIGLTMASVGIYATVAQSTARRAKEIGIRLALGASQGSVLRLILRRGLLQMILGISVGLALAFSTTHLLSGNLLIRVSPRDPLVFACSCSILVAIGWFASWLPARIAVRIDPSAALRDE